MMNEAHTQKHISHLFDGEISEIKDQLILMGAEVELQFATIAEAIQKNQPQLLSQISPRDTKINEMEVNLDERCNEVLALRQPRAIDLRYVIATSRISGVLETSGDLLKEIAQYAERILEHERHSEEIFKDIRHIFDMASKMLKNSLDSFVRLHVDTALQVCRQDKDLDTEYKNAVRLLMSQVLENPSSIARVINQMWILNSLFRFGEQMREMASYVIFVVKGDDVRHLSHKRIEKLLNNQEQNNDKSYG